MRCSKFLLIFTGILLLNKGKSFDAGFTRRGNTTHFALTECALLKVAISYLKTVHSSTNLDSFTTNSDICQDVQVMYNAIELESIRLKINSAVVLAINAICISNVDIDVEEFTSSRSHFDDELFADGSSLILNRLKDAQTKLMTSPTSIVDARKSFGRAIHTLQDFYAHSNWVELGNRVPNPAIGTTAALGKYATLNMRTCQNCTNQSCAESNILPEIIANQYLTSGYFSIWPSAQKPIGKCSHGGTFDMTTRSDAIGFGINKDNIESDHHLFHLIAAQIALSATMQQLNSLWTAVGNDIFGQFLGFSSTSLVFVVDTTGSMGPYIDLVKQIAIGIVEATSSSDSQFTPTNYILSPFNDPTWGPVTVTSDPQELIDTLNGLTANGGGDWPELYYHGVDNALQACEMNSLIYTFTDAGAKDFDLRPRVLSRAMDLNVKIFSFYAGGAPSSGRRRRRRDTYEIIDGSNGKDVATATGGCTVGLQSSQDANATASFVVRRLLPQQSLLILSASGPISSTFVVDSQVTRIQIDLTSDRQLSTSLSNSLRLFNPNGMLIQPVPTTSTSYFRLYSIDNPLAGTWQFSTNQPKPHSVEISIPAIANNSQTVTCTTTLSQQLPGELIKAYVPLRVSPIVNQTNLVLVTSCTNLAASLQSVSIQLIDQSGRVIMVLNTSNITNNEFAIIPLVIPDSDFRILAQIELNDSSLIQRQSNVLISPTSISITINNQPCILIGNDTTNISFTIDNHAPETLLIQMCALDTLGLLGSSGLCRNYSIANGSRINDIIDISMNMSSQQDFNETNFNATSASITFNINARDSFNDLLDNYNTIQLYYQSEPFIETPAIVTK